MQLKKNVNNDFEIQSPGEFVILIETYKKIENKDRKETATKILKSIDKSIKKINQDTSRLLIKNEIYKTIIEYPYYIKPFQLEKTRLFQKFKLFFKLNKKNLSPLAVWVCEMIDQESRKNNQSKIRQKVIQSWMKAIVEKNPKETNLYFENVLIKLFYHIDARLSLFLKYSQPQLKI